MNKHSSSRMLSSATMRWKLGAGGGGGSFARHNMMVIADFRITHCVLSSLLSSFPLQYCGKSGGAFQPFILCKLFSRLVTGSQLDA